jgi:hypothetical protein
MKLNMLITLLAIITPLIANAGYTQSRLNIEIAAANQEIRDSGMSYSEMNLSMANADGGKTLKLVYRGKTFDDVGDDLACAVSMRKTFTETMPATYIADFIRNGYTRVKFVVGNKFCYYTL